MRSTGGNVPSHKQNIPRVPQNGRPAQYRSGYRPTSVQRRPSVPNGQNRNQNTKQNKKSGSLLALIAEFVKKNRTAVIAVSCILAAAIIVPIAVAAASGGDPEPDIENTCAVTAPEGGDCILAASLDAGKLTTGGNDTGKTDTAEPAETKEPTETKGTADTADTAETADTEPDTAKVTEPKITEPVETLPPPAPTYTVSVYFSDREPLFLSSEEDTLRNVLYASGYYILDSDEFSIDLDEVISEDTVVYVDTVTYDTVEEIEYLPYGSQATESQSVPRGTTQVVSEGQYGEKVIGYTVKYVNGAEISREKQYEYVASEPVDEIVSTGVGGTFTAPDGNTYSYSYVTTCRATYYNLPGTTATGAPVGDDVCAVDPNTFPLGTTLYVFNDRFDMGIRHAEDVGGAVKGDLIDLWMNEGSPNYAGFAPVGLDTFTVYVLD